MMTLQTFTTPMQFILKLAERYCVPPNSLNDSDLVFQESLNAMKAKVCNVLYGPVLFSVL